MKQRYDNEFDSHALPPNVATYSKVINSFTVEPAEFCQFESSLKSIIVRALELQRLSIEMQAFGWGQLPEPDVGIVSKNYLRTGI